MSKIQIRVAGEVDRDTAVGIHRASALAGFGHIYPPQDYPFPDESEGQEWSRLLSDPKATVLLAQHGDAPLGVAVVRGIELTRFFVVPEAWGKGIAGVLHEAVIDLMSAQGSTMARLWVLKDNERARRFYERRGWRLDGRLRSGSFPPYPPAVGYTRPVENPVRFSRRSRRLAGQTRMEDPT